jgi:hypothetical protein
MEVNVSANVNVNAYEDGHVLHGLWNVRDAAIYYLYVKNYVGFQNDLIDGRLVLN